MNSADSFYMSEKNMTIRKTMPCDVPAVLSVYDGARKFMAENGNPNQWTDGYPDESTLLHDIERRVSYVITEDSDTAGTFSFILGEEETYRVIENGCWREDMPYGTIHRLASAQKCRGIAKVCFDYCKERCSYLRIDTHRDNKPMQAAIEKYGFKKCGIIHVKNGSERIAYDYIRVK